MTEVVIAVIVVVGILVAVTVYNSRHRREMAEGGLTPPTTRRGPTATPAPDPVLARPAVAGFRVLGEEAQVTFDVPLPDDDDDVLSDLLVGEAIEVVREKRHNLPIDDVTQVVALAGRGEAREVGRASLETPGMLPPPSQLGSILNLHTIARDPFGDDMDDDDGAVPQTAAPVPTDELGPIGESIRLPRAVATGLRAQGIDPVSMSAADLVTGVLALFGYAVTPGIGDGTYTASRGGVTTFIVHDPYRPGDYPEVGDDAIRRFIVEFNSSGAQRGMLVSEKFAPFSVHDRERRDNRVRFVTRERLQKLVDSMALS